MDEALIQVECPYCGSWQELILDPGSVGQMVEDCEVCCRPWEMTVVRGRSGGVTVHLSRMD